MLLVEDNANDAELTMLELEKYLLPDRVDLVRDGEEALDYMHRRGKYATRPEGNPPVVLLDLNLPKVSGLEVLREIKGNEKLRSTPVVVLTSSRADRDLIESYGYGVNAYVVKPIEFASFAKAISALGMFWAIVNQPPLTR
jgi:CheY-like chemotaxis protein